MARDRLLPAAMVCSVIANVHRNPDERSEPFSPADFLPGAKTPEDEMREFAEAVMRGDKFEVDPEAAAEFRRQMQSTFRNVVPAEVTQ